MTVAYMTSLPLSHVLSTTPALENTSIIAYFSGKDKSIEDSQLYIVYPAVSEAYMV